MEPQKYRNPNWVLPFWIFGGFEFIVCLCCLSFSIYIYRTHNVTPSNPNGMIAPSLKYMNLCGVISFLLCSIVQCINIWYWNVDYHQYSFVQTMTWDGTWFFWSVGIFMTYLLFLHRIRITFSNSSLQPSKCTLWSLYISLTIYLLLFLTSTILPIFLFIEGSNLTRSRLYDIQFVLPIPIAVLEILISLSMTWIFVSRLYSLILMQTVHHYDESIKSLPGLPTKMHSHFSLHQRTQALSVLDDAKYHRMMQISVKTSMLTIVSLTSSSILMALRAANCLKSKETPMAKLTEWWVQMDTVVSCICLVLFLPRTQRGFDVFCCCCTKLLSECLRNSLQKSTVRSLYKMGSSRAFAALESSPTIQVPAIRTTPSSRNEIGDITSECDADENVSNGQKSEKIPITDVDNLNYKIGDGTTENRQIPYETL